MENENRDIQLQDLKQKLELVKQNDGYDINDATLQHCNNNN